MRRQESIKIVIGDTLKNKLTEERYKTRKIKRWIILLGLKRFPIKCGGEIRNAWDCFTRRQKIRKDKIAVEENIDNRAIKFYKSPL